MENEGIFQIKMHFNVISEIYSIKTKLFYF